jgi:tRNA(fMet)-specific endonuclease VapC
VFVVLDTDHFIELVAGGALAGRISLRATGTEADLFSTIVTAQEVMQGWLAAINRERAGNDQLTAYARFHAALRDLQKLTLIPFDADAVARFHELQRLCPRIGTMDLKIAAICIAHETVLLSRNLVDSGKIPGLRVGNWLD